MLGKRQQQKVLKNGRSCFSVVADSCGKLMSVNGELPTVQNHTAWVGAGAERSGCAASCSRGGGDSAAQGGDVGRRREVRQRTKAKRVQSLRRNEGVRQPGERRTDGP